MEGSQPALAMQKAERIYVTLCKDNDDDGNGSGGDGDGGVIESPTMIEPSITPEASSYLVEDRIQIGRDEVDSNHTASPAIDDKTAMLTRRFDVRSRTVKSMHNKFRTITTTGQSTGHSTGLSSILEDMSSMMIVSQATAEVLDSSTSSSTVLSNTGGCSQSFEGPVDDNGIDDGDGDDAIAGTTSSTTQALQLTSAFSSVHGREPALTNWNGDFQG